MQTPTAADAVREYIRGVASKGGLARAAKLSPERRSSIARKAAKASAKSRRAKRSKA